jgi:hypothetical protein
MPIKVRDNQVRIHATFNARIARPAPRRLSGFIDDVRNWRRSMGASGTLL